MEDSKIKKLFHDHGGKIYSYKDLMMPAKLAIAQYMAIDGEAWRLPNTKQDIDFLTCKFELQSMIRFFEKEYGQIKFGYVMIPTESLIEQIMKELSEFENWEEYHKWYVGQGIMPKHTKKAPWPVILCKLDYNESEILQDGWHRFHRYYDLGLVEIPAVYFP